MKQTKARRDAPSPQPSHTPSKSPNNVFIMMALDMSWRLAIVVLVPVIGGFKLDDKLHTTPSFTIAGFLIAMVGMGLVLWRTLKVANQLPVPKLTATQKRSIKKQYEEDDE